MEQRASLADSTAGFAERSATRPSYKSRLAEALSIVGVHHAFLWLIASGVLWLAWTGFIASDDEYYALSGLGWLHEFPYVATHFGTVRAVVGIPIAVTVGLLGEREFTVVLSTCLFFLATASLTLAMLSRLIGLRAGFIACCVIATLPLFALKSTIASADLPALFFVASSFWLFLAACHRERKTTPLVAAGICAALAFSAHELTVALLLFYGLLFLIGHAIPRRQYWVMAIGFLVVIAIEGTYYAVLTGNPFHRFSLLLQGVRVSDRVVVDSGQIAAGGTLHVWEPLDPVLMLLLKHEFSLLGLLSLPGLWWAFTTSRRSGSQIASTARLFAGLGLTWLLVAAVALRAMILLPRYYMVTAYCLCIVLALWASVALWPRKRLLLVLGISIFVAANLAAIYVDDRNPRFGERALVEYLSFYSGPVYTDPLTAEDTQWFCRWAKAECRRIVAGPPAPGHVYFHNPKNADRPTRFVQPSDVHKYQPRTGWQERWRKEEPRRLSGPVIDGLGLTPHLPERIVLKLDRPNPTVRVFQVPE